MVEADQEPSTSLSTFTDQDPDFQPPAAKLQKTTKLEKSACDKGCVHMKFCRYDFLQILIDSLLELPFVYMSFYF